MAGGHINGRAALEGTMFGPSLFSGRVAGAWAAQEAGFGQGPFLQAVRQRNGGIEPSEESASR